MDNYFFIDREKEQKNFEALAKILEQSGTLDSPTVIIVCSPEYSSAVCQYLSHRLSHLNNNIPLDLDFLEMPYPNDVRLTKEQYLGLLTHLGEKYRSTGKKLLLIDSGCLRGTNFALAQQELTKYLLPEDVKFASTYKQSGSIFEPDFYVESFDFEKDGGLLFWWENINNPLWPW